MEYYRILPHPIGKEFAITFVDDTDLSTVSNTKPVYDLLCKKGLFGTKTVWVKPRIRNSAYRQDLEKSIDTVGEEGETLFDDKYREFIIDLKNNGFEIGLHGVAGGNSCRDEIIEGLDYFQLILGNSPNINIFHERNIDNLYSGNEKLVLWPFKLLEWVMHRSNYSGHRVGSCYFWGDVAKQKIKYMRLPFHNIVEINSLKVSPSMPFHDPSQEYVNYWFVNSDAADCGRFNSLFNEENIDKLKNEFGVCIAYTHFAKGFARKGDDGMYVLDAEFVRTVDRISSFSECWFPTVTELLDRLLLCQNIDVSHVGNILKVTNKNDIDVPSLSILTPKKLKVFDAGGGEIRQSDSNILELELIPANSSISFYTDIEGKGKTNVFTFNRTRIFIERARIEIYNYFGLLKRDILKRI